MKSATLKGDNLNGPPHDPVSIERREIAALLRQKADHHEKRAGEIQHNEALSLTRKKAAGSYRAIAQAILDRPAPDPTSRPFTSDEREALRVLLDQLFEAAGGQGQGHALALAAQLGLELTHTPEPPPIVLNTGGLDGNGVAILMNGRVLRAYIRAMDVSFDASPIERVFTTDRTEYAVRQSMRIRVEFVEI